ncbi:hypothetical protein EJ06DRAFT_526449 [Trichodelitschia bisporula]|uniref:Uncharacterized protein n=1 Tax=Trichodelitschia bisporula TaxID=703511 RepID=A0A6G1I7U5_9PEZI|nr:hypothetical protein EJ06DRAFT_526449 [Trichodelitschia bisporula]
MLVLPSLCQPSSSCLLRVFFVSSSFSSFVGMVFVRPSVRPSQRNFPATVLQPLGSLFSLTHPTAK